MKKYNFYDAFLLIFVFTAAYILGIHSALPNKSTEAETVEVMVRAEKTDFMLSKGEVCLDASGTELTVVSTDGDEITLTCEGVFYSAGFLSSGGKYLCDNQPITLKSKDGPIPCRIIRLSKIRDDAA